MSNEKGPFCFIELERGRTGSRLVTPAFAYNPEKYDSPLEYITSELPDWVVVSTFEASEEAATRWLEQLM